MDMRGLSHFIRDIRSTAGNRRMEEERVAEELAKIRAKFIDDRHMTLYDRKKYVCKLMFIAMLGYPVTFGHLEGLKLMAEETPSEKLIGYLSVTVLLNENSPMMSLTTHTIYRDLLSGIDFNKGLALTAIANIGNKEFVEVMQTGVQDIVLKEVTNADILKRAILTLLCVYRKYPEIVDLRLVVEKLSDYLSSSSQESLVMACVSFMQGTIQPATQHLYSGVASSLIQVLSRIINEKKTDPGNIYYGVPTPWMQCKLLRLLQCLEPPSTSSTDYTVMRGVLRKIIGGTEKVLSEAQTQQKQRGTTNRVNAMISVLFEVISLIIKWSFDLPLITESVALVGRFITTKKGANIRYIGLTLLSRFSIVRVPGFDYGALCKEFEQHIVVALHESDVSLRLKALNVLMAMCNEANAPDIVKELLAYLPLCTDPLFKSRLLLSIAHLSERYFQRSSSQYVDVMLAAIKDAGDLCPPQVLQRAIHSIVSYPAVQKRAVLTAFHALKKQGFKNEPMVRIASFLIGEYGCQIALNPESPPVEQVVVLRNHLPYVGERTQTVMLHGLLKLYNVYGSVEVREKILKVLRGYACSSQLSLQQCATEYLALLENASPSLLNQVLESMPPFGETTSNEATELIQQSEELWKRNRMAAEGQDTTSCHQHKPKPKAALPLKKLYESLLPTDDEVVSNASSVSASASPTKADIFAVRVPDEQAANTVEHTRHLALLQECLRQGAHTAGRYLLFQDAYVDVFVEEQKFVLADARLKVTVAPSSAAQRGAETVERSSTSPELTIAGVESGLMLEYRVVAGNQSGSLLQVEFAARSAYPFSAPPSLRLLYTTVDRSGQKVIHAKSFALPIVSPHFLVPYEHSQHYARIYAEGMSSGDSRETLEEFVSEVRVRGKTTTTTPPLQASITAVSGTNEQTLREVMVQLGYTLVEGDRGRGVTGIAAHSTSPCCVWQCRPVLCEAELVVMKGTAVVCLTVYADHPLLQESVLSSFQLHLGASK